MSPAATTSSRKRLTQAERRQQTREKVLLCALAVFGERGYADASLAEIAERAGITVTPIYHYFGNKLQLFTAVTEHYEARFAANMAALGEREQFSLLEAWDVFVDMMQDPAFTRVVLMDATHVLGRERWPETSVFREVKKLLSSAERPVGAELRRQFSDAEVELLIRMAMSALAEAALSLAADPALDARRLMTGLLAMLGLENAQGGSR